MRRSLVFTRSLTRIVRDKKHRGATLKYGWLEAAIDSAKSLKSVQKCFHRLSHRKSLAILFIGAIAPGAVLAEPGTVNVGPIKIEPVLSSAFAYDDNIFHAGKEEVGSTVVTVSPAVTAFVERGVNRYAARAEVINETYAQSSDDNTLDVALDVDLHHEFSSKQALDVYASLDQTHEDRGEGLSRGGFGIAGIDEPLEYDESVLGARYTLGNNRTFGRVALAYDEQDRQYQNFKETTEFFDRKTQTTSATLYYNLTAKTALLLEARQQDVTYDRTKVGVASLDAQESTGLVGVEWQATAKTSGYLKWGYFDREFEAASRGDNDGTRWDASITWAPRSYSTVTVSAAQRSDETESLNVEATGDFIERETLSVAWNHELSARTQFSIAYTAETGDYAGSTGRDEDLNRWSASLSRVLDRWITLKASYEHETLDSNSSGLSYDRNQFFIGVDMTL